MTIHKNPASEKNVATPQQAGELVVQPCKFDFAASYTTDTLALNDQVLVGVVPAGAVLVQHLSRISLPAFETDGSPTGDYTVGTDADPDALIGTGAAETARVLSGEDFTAGNVVGDRFNDTPIYAKFSEAVTAVTTTGVITADLVFRAWQEGIDDVTS